MKIFLILFFLLSYNLLATNCKKPNLQMIELLECKPIALMYGKATAALKSKEENRIKFSNEEIAEFCRSKNIYKNNYDLSVAFLGECAIGLGFVMPK